LVDHLFRCWWFYNVPLVEKKTIISPFGPYHSIFLLHLDGSHFDALSTCRTFIKFIHSLMTSSESSLLSQNNCYSLGSQHLYIQPLLVCLGHGVEWSWYNCVMVGISSFDSSYTLSTLDIDFDSSSCVLPWYSVDTFATQLCLCVDPMLKFFYPNHFLLWYDITMVSPTILDKIMLRSIIWIQCNQCGIQS